RRRRAGDGDGGSGPWSRGVRPRGFPTRPPLAAAAPPGRLQRLNCGDGTGAAAGLLDRLGVKAIAFHLGLYKSPDPAWFALKMLGEHGWHVQRSAGSVLLFERAPGSTPVLQEPDRTQPVFCLGWYGATGNGRYMSETHAPFW